MHNLEFGMITKYLNVKYFTLSICAIIFSQMFYYVYENATPMIRADGWYYIQIYLIPWLDSSLSVKTLWSNHVTQPLTVILFILNARFFDLQMNYEALFAASFSLLLFGSIYYTICSSFDKSSPKLEVNLLHIVVASILFSLTSVIVLTWSLMTLGYIALSMVVLGICFLDKLTVQNTRWQLFGLTVGLCLLLLSFPNEARFYLYSAIIVIFIRSLIQRKSSGLTVLVPLIISLIFIYLFILEFGNTRYNEAKVLTTILHRPQYFLNYIEYIGVGLLSPWLNISAVVKNTDYGHSFFINCGHIALVVYLLSLILYFVSDLSRKTIMPGVFIFAVLLTALGGAIFRYVPAVQSPMSANVPRYYLYYMVGVIGVVWIWTYCLLNVKRRNLGRAGAIIIFSAVLYSQYFSSTWAHAISPHLKRANVINTETMIKHANGDMSWEIPFGMVGNNYPEPYLSGLDFLKEHQLNVFRKTPGLSGTTD
jgi:hypothetical protein